MYVFQAFRSPTTQNFSDLDFDLSMSPKVRPYCIAGLLIHDSLLVFNSNMV